MKKIIVVISLLCLCAVGGCSSANSNINVNEVGEALKSAITFEDTLTKIDFNQSLNLYGLSEAEVSQCAVYVGSGATAEEISVWQAIDSDAAAVIGEKVQNRVNAQLEGYADYKPAEVPKLKSCIFVMKDLYVVLCVSNDNATTKKVLKDFSL